MSDDKDGCSVDLVAEPFPPMQRPERATLDEAVIAVDSRHKILVSKLTALLGRTELRDLVDAKARGGGKRPIAGDRLSHVPSLGG